VRLALLNAQSGVGVTRGYWQYLVRGHRYVVAHDAGIVAALAQFIARRQIDVLACTETEGTSWRSSGVDYVAALAASSPLRHAAFFATLRLAGVVNQGNSIHSAAPLVAIREHVLPGRGERRVLGEAQLGVTPMLTVFVTHLSLGARARARQLEHIAGVVRGRSRVVVVGDFNTSDVGELAPLTAAGLRHVASDATYPSWRPRAALDYLLCSADVHVRSIVVDTETRLADHLPIIAELE
jgi:endonuclease/exonuclease/phosphatase family metal-dependent hydrolase